MSADGVYEMFVAPAWVATPEQWAGWWLASKLRGPLLDMHDLGLDTGRPGFDPSGPRWSVRDFGEVTDERIDRFAAAVERAVHAVTDQGGTAELTVERGHSALLADAATVAGISEALLPRIVGPWTITVTARQARMRPFLALDAQTRFTGDDAAGFPRTGADAPEIVMWPPPATTDPVGG